MELFIRINFNSRHETTLEDMHQELGVISSVSILVYIPLFD